MFTKIGRKWHRGNQERLSSQNKVGWMLSITPVNENCGVHGSGDMRVVVKQIRWRPPEKYTTEDSSMWKSKQAEAETVNLYYFFKKLDREI